jgi:hypothetical protein
MTTTSTPPAEPVTDQTSDADDPRRWWWRRLVAGTVLTVAILGVGAWIVYGLDATPGMAETSDMADMAASGEMVDARRVPPVAGYYDDTTVSFIHTEASDLDIADTLTAMMDSPVPVVASLAEVPPEARSSVYVFTNGVQPDGPRGPLGFQPDVFPTAPGDTGFTPLREIVLVTWVDQSDAEVLMSADAIEEAERTDRLRLEPTGVVVNMPMLTWPGGQR